MYYLMPETLEILIFSLIKNKPVPLAAYSLSRITKVIHDLEKINILSNSKLVPTDINDATESFLDRFNDALLNGQLKSAVIQKRKELSLNKTPLPSPETISNLNNEQWEKAKDVISLKLSASNKLTDFFEKYIQEFEIDSLESIQNFYSYQKHIDSLKLIFGSNFDEYGYSFSINKAKLSSEFRFYELALSLQNKGHLIFKDCAFNIHKIRPGMLGAHTILDIKIQLKKSPIEIFDILHTWDYCYGDLRISSKGNIVYYKKHRYRSKSVPKKTFTLLTFLIKNPGKWFSFNELYNIIDPNNKIPKDTSIRKEKICDYLKDIKQKLGITQDKNPTIEFLISNNRVKLVSKP